MLSEVAAPFYVMILFYATKFLLLCDVDFFFLIDPAPPDLSPLPLPASLPIRGTPGRPGLARGLPGGFGSSLFCWSWVSFSSFTGRSRICSGGGGPPLAAPPPAGALGAAAV